MSDEQTYYLITFKDFKENKNITLKAKTIKDSNLGLSFVAVSDFAWNRRDAIIDVNEDNLRKRFESTKRLHLSLYSILSIEEVGSDHPGLKFETDKSKLLVLQTPSKEERT